MNLKIDSDTMFKTFLKIADIIPRSHVKEISVKQHQIVLRLDSKVFCLADALSITHDIMVDPSSTYVTEFEGEFRLIIDDIPDDIAHLNSDFKPLVEVIRYMSEHICTCPMLEYVLSDMYIKCYLDKPGLKLEDIKKLEELFKSQCTLELTGQRPYALFVLEVS